jgi:hypothetical protein
MSPGMWNLLKDATKEIDNGDDDHLLFVVSSQVDDKETDVSFKWEKSLEVTTMLISSKQDNNAYRREKINGYTVGHTFYLQNNVFDTIYGVGALQAHPKLKDEIDYHGQMVLVRHICTSILVGTNVNIVTHIC